MGYLHIENLYKPESQDILLFKECYALEKIHGTSAHIKIHVLNDKLTFFSGGVSHQAFIDCIGKDRLLETIKAKSGELPNDIEFTVFGEAYGGSCQKMSGVYGKELRFIVFDVQVGEIWLDVLNAEDIANKLGLEFVHYVRIPTDLELINKERDRPSVQAVRNGMGEDKMGEGIVLRPIKEFIKANGKRLISKHKRPEFSETKTEREVSPEKLKVLTEANSVAEEWVTEMRLIHVLDKLDAVADMSIMPKLIPAMMEDVRRESEGEVEWNKDVSSAVTRMTGVVLREYLAKAVR